KGCSSQRGEGVPRACVVPAGSGAQASAPPRHSESEGKCVAANPRPGRSIGYKAGVVLEDALPKAAAAPAPPGAAASVESDSARPDRRSLPFGGERFLTRR